MTFEGGEPVGGRLRTGWWMTTLLCALAVSAAAFVSLVDFSRSIQTPGFLTPRGGLAYVRAPQTGVVLSVLVRPGDVVEQGQPLASISTDVVVSGNQSSGELLTNAAGAETAALTAELAGRAEVTAAQLAELASQQSRAKARVASLAHRVSLQEIQVALANETVSSAEPAFSNGYIAPLRMRQYRAALIEAQSSLSQLKDDYEQAKSTLAQLQSNVQRLRGEEQVAKASFAAQSARIAARRADPQLGGEIIIRAPRGGRIGSLAVNPGQPVAAGAVMGSIVPADAPLDVELWAPSRAANFLAPGDVVKVRFDAFPYQQFGTGEAKVVSVALAPLAPEDAPSAVGAKEPLYPVRAALASQSLKVNGRERSLVTGMKVTAIVVLERRTILNWMLAPLNETGSGS